MYPALQQTTGEKCGLAHHIVQNPVNWDFCLRRALFTAEDLVLSTEQGGLDDGDEGYSHGD